MEALLVLQGNLLACIKGSHTPRTRFTTHCSALRTRPRGLSGGGAVRARFFAAATGSLKVSLSAGPPSAPPPLPSCVSDSGEDSEGGGTQCRGASDLDASMKRLRYSASPPSCAGAPACINLAAAAWLTSSTRSEGTELFWKAHRRTDSDSKPCIQTHGVYGRLVPHSPPASGPAWTTAPFAFARTCVSVCVLVTAHTHAHARKRTRTHASA